MNRILATALAIAVSASVCNQGTARADDVKLLSALVMKPALIDLAGIFERTGGHKLAIAYDSAGAVTKRIQSGETVDTAIIQKPAIEALIKEGKMASGSNVVLARARAWPQRSPEAPPNRILLPSTLSSACCWRPNPLPIPFPMRGTQAAFISSALSNGSASFSKSTQKPSLWKAASPISPPATARIS